VPVRVCVCVCVCVCVWVCVCVCVCDECLPFGPFPGAGSAVLRVHISMIPPESPAKMSPLLRKAKHCTNLGFSYFCQRHTNKTNKCEVRFVVCLFAWSQLWYVFHIDIHEMSWNLHLVIYQTLLSKVYSKKQQYLLQYIYFY